MKKLIKKWDKEEVNFHNQLMKKRMSGQKYFIMMKTMEQCRKDLQQLLNEK